jgi:hypothetical protein
MTMHRSKDMNLAGENRETKKINTDIHTHTSYIHTDMHTHA